MLPRLDRLIAQTLNALLIAASIGFAITLWREPAGAPPALVGKPAATTGGLKHEPTAAVDASIAPSDASNKPTPTTGTDAPAAAPCSIGLASCRRWISLRERKGRLLMHGTGH